ncbi:MAG: hypothetical protein HY535_00655 [Chloroflexi bacterium]|nr:hypothetical protein [Chloroflexota bacterium]
MDGTDKEIRGIRLLDHEEVVLLLGAREGLTAQLPSQQDFLVLTTHRLLGYSRDGGKRRSVVSPLDEVTTVEVSDPAKSARPLMTGSLTVLAGAVVPVLANLLDLGGLIAWLIGIVAVLLGLVTVSTYFVAEETSSVAFHTRSGGVTFPLRSARARQDVYVLINRFFQRRDTASPPSYPGQTPGASRAVEAAGDPPESAQPQGGSHI